MSAGRIVDEEEKKISKYLYIELINNYGGSCWSGWYSAVACC
jgi:hypothetical protein